MTQQDTYIRGIMMSGAGMLLLSPDALLLRLITDASIWNVAFYRSVLITVALLVYLLVRYRSGLVAMLLHFGRAGWFSTALLAVSSLSFVFAINYTTVANALILVATMPFFSAVLGWLLIGEPVKGRTWLSIALAGGGMVIIFSNSLGGGNWFGDLMAILTAFLQGLNLTVVRKAKEREVTIPALAIAGILAALFVLPMAEPLQVGRADMGYLLLMGLVVVPVSMVLFLNGARYAPVAEVALLSLFETVLGPLWVWLGIGEVPDESTLIGGAVVIAAITVNAAFGISENRKPSRMEA